MQRETDEVVVVPKNELDEKDEKLKSLEAKCQKMKSDFTRYKERIEDNEKATREKVRGELAKRLLSVADTLDRAMNGYTTDSGCEVVETMAEGTRSNLEMTFNQLLNALEITSIVPPTGERFNDELHTAIETTTNNFLPDKTIVSFVRRGYMLDGELIRPAEVVISRCEEEKEKARSKPESIVTRFLRRIESRVFKQKFKDLEDREEKMSNNEEMLRRSAKELDAREEEFRKMLEKWEQRKETEESKINELMQSRAALTGELKGFNSQVCRIQDELNEMEGKKDIVAVESIALNIYNEELFERKGKLIKDIEETENVKESLNSELKELEEAKVKRYEELNKVEEELQRKKELLNKGLNLKDEEEIKEESKEHPLIELEMSL